MDDIIWMSAHELLESYRASRLSPVEVLGAVLERVERVNPAINAVVTLTADLAQEQARASEEAYRNGTARALEGVPVTIKDLIHVKGVRNTYGSRLFEDFVAGEDAVLVERLKGSGAVIVGKTNTPEFGLVAVTDNLVFGPSRNPWDISKTTGGSSGGAAASVVAGFGPLAAGNDGGGSIRIPASLCGAFGLKPQFGRVPSYPYSLHGWDTMNHEGPITRTVADAALMLNVMAGPDERDRRTLPASGVDYLEGLDDGIEGLRVAYTCDLSAPAVDPEVAEITRKAAFAMSELGCEVAEEDPGIMDMSGDLTMLVIAEQAAVHSENLDEDLEKMYPAFAPFIMLEPSLDAADIARIAFHREDIWDRLWRFFSRYDLLLTPTTACAAFDLKEGPMTCPDEINGIPMTPANWIAFTHPFNFTGQPAASVPCGFTASGLPVGLQIVGRRYDETTVLRASAAFENAFPWSGRHPDI